MTDSQHIRGGDGRSLPAKDGDTWRMDVSRFQWINYSDGDKTCPGWAWNSHGVYDSHIPECFTYLYFSEQVVSAAGANDG